MIRHIPYLVNRILLLFLFSLDFKHNFSDLYAILGPTTIYKQRPLGAKREELDL